MDYPSLAAFSAVSETILSMLIVALIVTIAAITACGIWLIGDLDIHKPETIAENISFPLIATPVIVYVAYTACKYALLAVESLQGGLLR